MVASGQMDGTRLSGTALLGELALDGSLRSVPGAMALVAAARGAGARDVIVPTDNAPEGSAVGGVCVRAARCLGEVIRHLAGVEELPVVVASPPQVAVGLPDDAPDLGSVQGQVVARRILEVAVAGRHNLALTGPPGVGKTLLARAAAGLLPPLAESEAAEVSRIHSVAGLTNRAAPVTLRRPFRAPHHTISTQALVGGGPRVRPGEASLAHHGALLLDETLQFRTDALDSLRGPLDAGSVTIARVDGVLELPARFMLLAAYNPCPCGWFAVRGRDCTCEDGARRRYQARLSGPMRDRLDLLVPIEPILRFGSSHARPEASATVAARVARAWSVQHERQGIANADLMPHAFDTAHGFDQVIRDVMDKRGRQMALSMRRIHRAARVARTIADLDGAGVVRREHLDEALLHRPKEVPA